MNLKETRWKFERAMETIREENEKNLKDGESELYRCCHEKTSYVSHYPFSTLLHEWVDRGQMHRPEKL